MSAQLAAPAAPRPPLPTQQPRPRRLALVPTQRPALTLVPALPERLTLDAALAASDVHCWPTPPTQRTAAQMARAKADRLSRPTAEQTWARLRAAATTLPSGETAHLNRAAGFTSPDAA